MACTATAPAYFNRVVATAEADAEINRMGLAVVRQHSTRDCVVYNAGSTWASAESAGPGRVRLRLYRSNTCPCSQ